MNKVALTCFLLTLTALTTALAQQSPITITLDHPNQSTPVPVDFAEVDFTGTVTIAPGFHAAGGTLDQPFNSSHTNSLFTGISDSFSIFIFGGTGTFTGVLFSSFLDLTTTEGLYSLQQFSNDLSRITVLAEPDSGLVTGVQASASQPFSVLVSNSVPENRTIVLLGLGLAAIYWLRPMREVRS